MGNERIEMHLPLHHGGFDPVNHTSMQLPQSWIDAICKLKAVT